MPPDTMTKTQKRRMRLIFIQSLIATLWSLYYGFYGDPIVNMQTGEMVLFTQRFLSMPTLLVCKNSHLSSHTSFRNSTYQKRHQRSSIHALAMNTMNHTRSISLHTTKNSNRNRLFLYIGKSCNALSVNYFWFLNNSITMPHSCSCDNTSIIQNHHNRKKEKVTFIIKRTSARTTTKAVSSQREKAIKDIENNIR